MSEVKLALAVVIGGFIIAPVWVYIITRMIATAYFRSKRTILTSKEPNECPRFGISP